jgi:hypothetical protein
MANNESQEAPATANDSQEELIATIQLLASALKTAINGHPVRNAPHCFGAAEKFTKGTEYEFRL